MILNNIVTQIGLQSQTYSPSCVFGLFFCDEKTWLHGIFYQPLFLLLCSFLFICQEVTWQDFCPWMSFHISPLLQRSIWFSLFKNPAQALYETLRKTFLALSKPKMFQCTHGSEQSKSWHYTSDTCPCKLLGVHPCKVSELDPNGIFIVKTTKYPQKSGNLWNTIIMANQLCSAFRCS